MEVYHDGALDAAWATVCDPTGAQRRLKSYVERSDFPQAMPESLIWVNIEKEKETYGLIMRPARDLRVSCRNVNLWKGTITITTVRMM